MTDYKTHNGTLYDYTAGAYCGVLVKESVMRRLVKLQAQHLEQVKRLLSNELDRGNVFSSNWTLHYPNGEQVVVRFIDNDNYVKRRIDTATHANSPKAVPLCFIAGSMEEAKEMADARFAETSQIGD